MAGEGHDGNTEGRIGRTESCEAGNLCAQAVADTYGPNACKLEPSTSQAPGWLPGLQICGSSDTGGKSLASSSGEAPDAKSQQVDPEGKYVAQAGETNKSKPASDGDMQNSQQVDGEGKHVVQTGELKKSKTASEGEMLNSQQVDGEGKHVPQAVETKKSSPESDRTLLKVQQTGTDGGSMATSPARELQGKKLPAVPAPNQGEMHRF